MYYWCNVFFNRKFAFVSNLALLLGNLIFNCEILNQKAEEENNEVSQNKNIVNAIEIKEKV